MHTLAKVSLFLGVASLSFGATWTGKLIDATCHDQPQAKNTTASCEIMANTSSFALQTATGSVLKLDAAGNSKASALIKADVAKFKNAQFRVEGDQDGEMVKVSAIEPVNNTKSGD